MAIVKAKQQHHLHKHNRHRNDKRIHCIKLKQTKTMIYSEMDKNHKVLQKYQRWDRKESVSANFTKCSTV